MGTYTFLRLNVAGFVSALTRSYRYTSGIILRFLMPLNDIIESMHQGFKNRVPNLSRPL